MRTLFGARDMARERVRNTGTVTVRDRGTNRVRVRHQVTNRNKITNRVRPHSHWVRVRAGRGLGGPDDSHRVGARARRGTPHSDRA